MELFTCLETKYSKMGRILVIPNSDFSRNRILKVDITKLVKKSIDSQTQISYSSSTVSVNNPSLKNND